MASLSVIVVNWNTRDLLARCLESLRLALAGTDAEVIVVDNASADGSAAMVAERFPEVRLIANRENRNYAEGNNQGIEASTGRYLLLLNPDTEVPPGAPGALVRFLEERTTAGAVAPGLVGPDGARQASVRGFPAPAALLGEITGLGRLFPSSRLGAYRPRLLPRDAPSPVDQPMASALLLRREALEQVGSFDPAFPLFFNDVDLCYRLREAGWEIWYLPQVEVLHVGGASTRQVRPEAVALSHQGLERFYDRHYRRRLGPVLHALAVAAIRLSGWLRTAAARRAAARQDNRPAKTE